VDGSCVTARHNTALHIILEGRTLGKSIRGRRWIQLVDDLLETKNYADLKKAAEDRASEEQKERLSKTCSPSRSLMREIE